MHVTTRNRTRSRGIPDFLGESPCNDITFSKTRHNLAKKSPRTRRREISPHYLCKKEQPSWKTEKLAHFEISNAIYDKTS